MIKIWTETDQKLNWNWVKTELTLSDQNWAETDQKLN